MEFLGASFFLSLVFFFVFLADFFAFIVVDTWRWWVVAGGVAGGFVFVVFGFAGPTSVVGYGIVFGSEGVLGMVVCVCVEWVEGSEKGVVTAGGGAAAGIWS